MELTKAQAKRQRQLKTLVNDKLRPKLLSFKNNYMGRYKDFYKNQIIRVASKFPDAKEWKDLEYLIGQKNDEHNIMSTTYVPRNMIHTHETKNDIITQNDIHREFSKISKARKQLEMNSILDFKFLDEANKGYEEKFERFAQKVMTSSLNPKHSIKVVSTNSFGGELEIEITDYKDVTLHARFIFAEGQINVPHYRFIVTERK